jgi:hypothetical protein
MLQNTLIAFSFLLYEEKTHANGELDHATLPDAITEKKKLLKLK